MSDGKIAIGRSGRRAVLGASVPVTGLLLELESLYPSAYARYAQSRTSRARWLRFIALMVAAVSHDGRTSSVRCGAADLFLLLSTPIATTSRRHTRHLANMFSDGVLLCPVMKPMRGSAALLYFRRCTRERMLSKFGLGGTILGAESLASWQRTRLPVHQDRLASWVTCNAVSLELNAP